MSHMETHCPKIRKNWRQRCGWRNREREGPALLVSEQKLMEMLRYMAPMVMAPQPYYVLANSYLFKFICECECECGHFASPPVQGSQRTTFESLFSPPLLLRQGLSWSHLLIPQLQSPEFCSLSFSQVLKSCRMIADQQRKLRLLDCCPVFASRLVVRILRVQMHAITCSFVCGFQESNSDRQACIADSSPG